MNHGAAANFEDPLMFSPSCALGLAFTRTGFMLSNRPPGNLKFQVYIGQDSIELRVVLEHVQYGIAETESDL
jgi:hypothetical protein